MEDKHNKEIVVPNLIRFVGTNTAIHMIQRERWSAVHFQSVQKRCFWYLFEFDFDFVVAKCSEKMKNQNTDQK